MDSSLTKIKTALSATLPSNLVDTSFSKFAELKKDFTLGSFHSSAAGHFVEAMADILVYIETGNNPPARPRNLDDYFNNLQSNGSLPESLRVVMARALRSLNTFRNKRTCHNLEVDPNHMDARYAIATAQWILAELIRVKAGLSHDEAESVIDWITAPLGGVIEDFGSFKTVLVKCKAEDEVLLLMSTYSDWVKPVQIKADMSLIPSSTVQTALSRLRTNRDVVKDDSYYKLTQNGRRRAEKAYKEAYSKLAV